MKPDIRSGIESVLITLLAMGLCFWWLLSAAQQPEPPVARVVMLALGLSVATAMHCVFAMKLVRRSGRSYWPWFVAVVLLTPVGTAVLLAVLFSESDEPPKT